MEYVGKFISYLWSEEYTNNLLVSIVCICAFIYENIFMGLESE